MRFEWGIVQVLSPHFVRMICGTVHGDTHPESNLFVGWARRLGSSARSLFTVGDVAIILVLFALLLMPALALEAAEWPLAMGTVIPVLFFSVAFGFMLSRSHYNELIALMMSGIYGGAFVLFFAAVNEPGNILAGINSVFQRSITWLVDAASGGINQDEVDFYDAGGAVSVVFGVQRGLACVSDRPGVASDFAAGPDPRNQQHLLQRRPQPRYLPDRVHFYGACCSSCVPTWMRVSGTGM